MEEHDKIELRSEEVQEILGTPPGKIVKWGTLVVFLSVLGMAWLSWWVKYPDKIKVPITLKAMSPPVKVVARTDSYIAKLIVNNEEAVERGQLLAVLQSTANHEDVLKLDTLVQQFQYFDGNQLMRLKPKRGLEIGTLQTVYAVFLKSLEAYQYGTSRTFNQRSKVELTNQIKNLKRRNEIELEKLNSNRSKITVERKTLKRMQKLYSLKGISLQQLTDVSTKLEDLGQAVKNNQSNIESNKNQILTINNEIIGIDRNYRDDNHDNIIELRESINRLQTEISDWKMKYLLPAPVPGEISFFNLLSEKQFYNEGEELMSIVPPGGDSIMGLMFLPSLDKGKVKEGQTVVIKLASFAYSEYGSVQGKIVNIGRVPRNNRYPVTVSLPNGLITSYNIPLSFDQEMDGLAEVITEKKRFYQKVKENILGKVNNYQ